MKNKQYTSVDKMIEELDEEHRKHRVGLWFYRHFWALVRLPGEIRLAITTFIQRGKRGWAVSDTWGFDSYLSKVIYESLKHFKKHKNGYPSTMNPDTGEYDYDEKRWEFILDELIWTFAIAGKIGETIYYIPSVEWVDKKYNELVDIADYMNKKYPNDEQHRVLTKEEVKRYETGFDYFMWYFHNLWD